MALRWEHEKSLPVRHIDPFGSMRPAVRCLQNNEVLGIAMDGGGGKDWVAVDFLGRRARFSTGPSRLAQMTGCAVLPTFMLRQPGGANLLVLEPPLPVSDPGETDRTGIPVLLARFIPLLERAVMEHKSHYLQFLALRRFLQAQGEPPFLFLPGEEDGHAATPVS